MKKTILLVSAFFILCIFSGSVYETETHQNLPPPVGPNSFIYGAFESGWDINYTYVNQTLGFNLWHLYTGNTTAPDGRNIPTGWILNNHINGAPGDSLNATHSQYVSQVQGVLNNVKNNNMTALMMRPKIEWLCFGQRSDYQCESGNVDPDLWFYSFNEHDPGHADFYDDTQYGNNQWVRYCEVNPNQTDGGAGWVVKRLKANSEQCRGSGADFHGDTKQTWLIKPSIRIDEDFANNPANLNAIICKIEVFDKDGNSIKRTHLRTRHFLDQSGDYDGNYQEEFRYQTGDTILEIFGDWGDWWQFSARGEAEDDNGRNKADIQVYWYGECDMWIDYIRVDNDVADGLMNPNSANYNTFNEWIEWEADDIAGYDSGDASYRFYIELFEFNNTPCMEYVNRKLDSITNGKSTLMCMPIPNYFAAHVPWERRLSVQNADFYKEHLIDKVGLQEIFIGYYPFNSSYNHPEVYNPDYDTWSKIPNTLSSYDDAGTLANPFPPDEYDSWLQMAFDSIPYSFEPAFNGGFRYTTLEDQGGMRYNFKFADSVSKESNIPFIYNAQGHLWFTGTNGGLYEVQREPTNQELDMVSNLSITYGAKGLIYFRYPCGPENPGDTVYNRGFVDWGHQPRTVNEFGQNKWQAIISQSQRIKKWESHIMSFDNANRHSYIYRLEEERNSLLNNTYFQDVATYKPGSGIPACEEDNPGGDAPQGYTYECNEDRYLQVATFNNPDEPVNKYFMIVNRRCSPHINESTDDNNGGRRKIKVRFDANATAFSGFNNWNIIDVESGARAITFDKRVSTLLDLGFFEPGQGRLYRITPVVTSGGPLVSDETIDGSVIISDTIVTDGYNLTITDGSAITFDTNGIIIAEGGNFICGDISGTQGVDLIGTSEWSGLKLNDCDTVKIFNTNMEDVKDSSYAIDMYNCKNVEMKYNTFAVDNNGAVRGSYIFTFGYFTPTVVLYENTVSTGANTMPVFDFNANSASSFPLIIDGCIMNAPSSSSSTAISITNITGGVIKNNEITGYNTSLLALSSSMDFYNNTIISSTSDCNISGSAGSTLGLRPAGGKFTGGENFFSTSHVDANNVEIYGGYFYAHDGYNTFDIAASYDDGKHFNGYFAVSEFSPSLEYNCFTEDGSGISPVYDVTWGSGGDPISFEYNYDCNAGEGAGLSSKSENSYLIVPITDGYNDTIKVKSGSYTLTVSDSMFIEIRKRNYSSVINIAERILENTPSSPFAIDAVSKLYLASLRLDSAGSKITPLKAFLEELILDNGNKPALVSRAFYFIQKCKAALGQYQSALIGFEDIINNNPNTYEALVASWDYAATTLLINAGQGGGSKKFYDPANIDELYSLKSFDDDPKDANDRSKQTKELQQVKVNVVKTFEETRKEEIKVINKLKERSERGDRNAKKELRRRELLQAVVTKREPADVFEHINNVNSDIRTVFNSSNENSVKKEQNSIPVEFELSQNFPNPFNPTTKIQYALPIDGKVQLVIYDILGREIAKLVNNEFKSAGRYVNEINGSRLASGVYFYRILVNDGKDFTQVKKMVLLK